MFSGHFQNIFSDYDLSELFVALDDTFFIEMFCKVLVRDCYTWEIYFTKDEFFYALSSMPNVKSPYIDGFPYEFYKEIWDTVEIIFVVLCVSYFPRGVF